MHTIKIITLIDAPADRCFDLARSVEAHVASAKATGERIVAGKTTGLLELGDELTFEARHLGVRQRLTGRITAFDRSRFFQDRMVRGAFRSLEHDHVFDEVSTGGTRMTDIVRFTAPFGPIGWLVERVLIAGHLNRFLVRRGQFLKGAAEGEGWRSLLKAN